MRKIIPCLWFDHQVEDAAKFYSSVFSRSKIGQITYYTQASAEVSGQKEGSVLTVDFILENLAIQGLNGGPIFKFSPSFSFLVNCESEEELNEKWRLLTESGSIRMPLDKYPWAEKYGWTVDRYGVDWQLSLSPKEEKIMPALLFVDELFGKGEEAIRFYTSIFPNSNIESIHHDDETKTVAHCAFRLNHEPFALMEGNGEHGFKFTHANSLAILCDSQEEIDHYWHKLSEGGQKEPCGWLKDKFGVSWQVVPSIMGDIMADPQKSDKAMRAMLQQKDPNLEEILKAIQ